MKSPENCYKCATLLSIAPGIGEYCPNPNCDVGDNVSGVMAYFAPAITPSASAAMRPVSAAESWAEDYAKGYAAGRLSGIEAVALLIEGPKYHAIFTAKDYRLAFANEVRALAQPTGNDGGKDNV